MTKMTLEEQEIIAVEISKGEFKNKYVGVIQYEESGEYDLVYSSKPYPACLKGEILKSVFKSGTRLKYFKFNNTRSKKYPFYVYVSLEPYGAVDTRGTRWSFGMDSEKIEITIDEFMKVRNSYLETEPQMIVGDKIVVLEYCGMKDRYGVLKTIQWTKGHQVVLEDGRTFPIEDVRRESFIHKN